MSRCWLKFEVGQAGKHSRIVLHRGISPFHTLRSARLGLRRARGQDARAVPHAQRSSGANVQRLRVIPRGAPLAGGRLRTRPVWGSDAVIDHVASVRPIINPYNGFRQRMIRRRTTRMRLLR